MQIENVSIQSFSMDPKNLKDGETGVSNSLKLAGDLDEETARQLGCLDSMYSDVSRVTSCKLERKAEAVSVKFWPLNEGHGKKPQLSIDSADIHGFGALHKGPSRSITFTVVFTRGVDLLTAFLMSQPGWVGSVEIEALQGELFAGEE